MGKKGGGREEGRVRLGVPGPAVVENPLEDAPNPKNLRCRPARSQPEAAWFLGAYPHETRHQNLPITFMKKSFTRQRTTPLSPVPNPFLPLQTAAASIFFAPACPLTDFL